MPLNHPGKWKFMISYVQADSIAEALSLSFELGRDDCWLDNNMDDKSEAAMKEAVANSDIFLCLLSPGYMKSAYCKKEVLWAQEFKRPIVSAYAAKYNVGAILKEAPSELAWLSAIDSKKLDLSDKEMFNVGVTKIKRAAQVAQLPPAVAAQTTSASAAALEFNMSNMVKGSSCRAKGHILTPRGKVDSNWKCTGRKEFKNGCLGTGIKVDDAKDQMKGQKFWAQIPRYQCAECDYDLCEKCYMAHPGYN
ncbi:hypothetical protein AB1Y20_013574 [Prymnesium parvum]|uniref:TIR domain-containing protein n=1 Tax=Prymnesium parvum TaxID=97485 RepID=A0AB34IFY8_PRYPA